MLSTKSLADRFGVTVAYVRRVAAANGIEPHYRSARTLLWSDGQAKRIGAALGR